MTSQLRNSLGDIYATYAATYFATMFLPYALLNWFQHISTLPITLAFSNTPGLLRPLTFDGRKSVKMHNYIIPAGAMGIGLSCLSYADYFKIGLVVDEAIMKEPHAIVERIEKNIRECMKRGEELHQ